MAARQGELSEGCKTFVQLARQGCAPEAGRVVRCIKPSDTDPAIKRFDPVNYVLVNEATPVTANLLVFLTGTFGKPPGPTAFLHAAADAGDRVISLDYNDEPAVNVYCPAKPPACSASFRRMRVYGRWNIHRPLVRQFRRGIDRQSIDQAARLSRSRRATAELAWLSG
jgi:hypothetical protein